jgi:redox-sensitive bicupin YhaK (pirin superfamily)
VRVIAGEFTGSRGPAQTFTPVTVLDVRLCAGHRVRLSLRDGCTASIYLLEGKVLLNGAEAASVTELVIFDRKGDEVEIETTTDATLFVMNGQPIEEPVVGHGPFVMNTLAEINQAFVDFHQGKLGRIPHDDAVS